MAGRDNLLPPMRPGETRNPRGSSRKMRARRYLKDAIHSALNGEVPEHVKAKLEELGFTARDIEDARYADAIAARLIGLAATGNSRELLDAISRISATEPQKIEHSGSIERPAPQLETDDPSLDEVASILDDAGALH